MSSVADLGSDSDTVCIKLGPLSIPFDDRSSRIEEDDVYLGGDEGTETGAAPAIDFTLPDCTLVLPFLVLFTLPYVVDEGDRGPKSALLSNALDSEALERRDDFDRKDLKSGMANRVDLI